MANIDYNSLGMSIDTSWGRSSTPKTASYSVKFTLLGADRMLATYNAVVNFASEKQMIEMKRAYATESQSVVNAVLKNIKSKYKDLTSSSLITKVVNSEDSVEITGSTLTSPRRTAIYRCKIVFEIG